MKILVFGQHGQVANEIAIASLKKNFSLEFLNRSKIDLLNPSLCAEIIYQKKPDAVINCAAWTDVDGAETSEDLASIINGSSPGNMASSCASLSIPFLHYSSDYVFDGSGNEPWQPNDKVNPLSAYGRSKVLGERLILESGAQAIIMRTSWIFSSHGRNFVKTMLKLGKENNVLRVVSDQVGAPTSAESIAFASLKIIEILKNGGDKGIVHFSGTPYVSWDIFARKIMKIANITCKIESVLSRDYPALAPRPLNSKLEDSTLLKFFNIERPNWEKDLQDVILKLNG